MTGRQGEAEDGGRGHPLPGSAEAREGEVPEHLVREKGHGDDARPAADPSDERTAPDGAPYRVGPDGG